MTFEECGQCGTGSEQGAAETTLQLSSGVCIGLRLAYSEPMWAAKTLLLQDGCCDEPPWRRVCEEPAEKHTHTEAALPAVKVTGLVQSVAVFVLP